MLAAVPEHGAPERAVAQGGAGEDVVHQVGGIVLVHGDLFEDDPAFGLDVVLAQQRRRHHVGDDVDRQRQIPIEHPRVVAGVLAGGERVELAADGLERAAEMSSALRAWVPLNSRCSR